MPPFGSHDRVLGYGGYNDEDGSSYGVDSLTSGFRKGDATAQAGTATRVGALLLVAVSSAFLITQWAAQPDALVFPGGELPIEDEAVRQSCAADQAGYHPKTRLIHAAVVAALSVVGTQAIVLWALSPNDRAGERRGNSARGDGSRLGARRGAALGICTTLLGMAQHAIGISQSVPGVHVPQGECGFFIDPATVAPAVANYVNLLLAIQLLSASPQGISGGARACALVVVAVDWFGSLADTMRSNRRTVPSLVVTSAATAVLAAAATRFGRLRAEVARLSRMRPHVADAVLDEAPALLASRSPLAGVFARCRGMWRRRRTPGPPWPSVFPLGTAASPDDDREQLGPLFAAVAAGRLPARDVLQLQAALARGRLKAAGTLALAFLGAVLFMDGALYSGILLRSPDSEAHEAGWVGLSVARDVLRFSVLPTVAAVLLALVQAEHNASRHALVRKLEQEERREEEQLMLRYGARRAVGGRGRPETPVTIPFPPLVSHELRTPLSSVSMGADEVLSSMADVMSVIVHWGHDTSARLRKSGAASRDDALDATFSRSLSSLRRLVRPILHSIRSAMGAARQGASLMQSVLDDMLRMQALRKGNVELSHVSTAPSEVLLDALAGVKERADAAGVKLSCVFLTADHEDAEGGTPTGGRDASSDNNPSSAGSSSRFTLSGPLSFFHRRSTASGGSPTVPSPKTRLRVLSRTEGRGARGRARQPPVRVHSQDRPMRASVRDRLGSSQGPPSSPLAGARATAPPQQPCGVDTMESSDSEGPNSTEQLGSAVPALGEESTSPSRHSAGSSHPSSDQESGGGPTAGKTAERALPDWLYGWWWRHAAGFYSRGRDTPAAAGVVRSASSVLAAAGRKPDSPESARAATGTHASRSYRAVSRRSRPVAEGLSTSFAASPNASSVQSSEHDSAEEGPGAEALRDGEGRVEERHVTTARRGHSWTTIPPSLAALNPFRAPPEVREQESGSVGNSGETKGGDSVGGNTGSMEAAREALDCLDACEVLRLDTSQVDLIFRALLANAIKFSDPGSTVTVVTSVALRHHTSGKRTLDTGSATGPVPGAFRSAAGCPRDHATGATPILRFAVHDGGRGMTREQQRTLFRPFARLRVGETERRGRGAGLSLAIARIVVEEHGGTIGGWSAGPDRGSVFWVELPSQAAASGDHAFEDQERLAEEEMDEEGEGRAATHSAEATSSGRHSPVHTRTAASVSLRARPVGSESPATDHGDLPAAGTALAQAPPAAFSLPSASGAKRKSPGSAGAAAAAAAQGLGNGSRSSPGSGSGAPARNGMAAVPGPPSRASTSQGETASSGSAAPAPTTRCATLTVDRAASGATVDAGTRALDGAQSAEEDSPPRRSTSAVGTDQRDPVLAPRRATVPSTRVTSAGGNGGLRMPGAESAYMATAGETVASGHLPAGAVPTVTAAITPSVAAVPAALTVSAASTATSSAAAPSPAASTATCAVPAVPAIPAAASASPATIPAVPSAAAAAASASPATIPAVPSATAAAAAAVPALPSFPAASPAPPAAPAPPPAPGVSIPVPPVPGVDALLWGATPGPASGEAPTAPSVSSSGQLPSLTLPPHGATVSARKYAETSSDEASSRGSKCAIPTAAPSSVSNTPTSPVRTPAMERVRAFLTGGHVLVVDDMRSARMLLRRTVQRLGATRVSEAADGQEALDAVEAAQREEAPVTLMLCDREMPNMNGSEAMRILVAQHFRGLIIGVTGSVMEADLDDMRNNGAHAVCRKPVQRNHLVNVIDELIPSLPGDGKEAAKVEEGTQGDS